MASLLGEVLEEALFNLLDGGQAVEYTLEIIDLRTNFAIDPSCPVVIFIAVLSFVFAIATHDCHSYQSLDIKLK